MTITQVVQLMESSKSVHEWNQNAKQVKEAFGGIYPDFWWPEIFGSGLADKTLTKCGGTAKMTVQTSNSLEELLGL